MTAISTNEILQLALEGLEYQKRGVEENISKIRLALSEMNGQEGRVVPSPSTLGVWEWKSAAIPKRRPGRPSKNDLRITVTTGGGETKTGEAAARHLSERIYGDANRRDGKRLSAEGRRRIADATKKRWAAYRKAKKAGVK